jgi:poly-gamma-glutamate synthesis protein (capsule biosynthesis protein)
MQSITRKVRIIVLSICVLFAFSVIVWLILHLIPSMMERSKADQDATVVKLAAVGQALIKIDPRESWANPFGTVKPILQSADVGFTNFEMSVLGPDDCGLSSNFNRITGEPDLGDDRPGNTSRPHAVEPNVMEFLASINLRLQSLANNHSWDLGDCGVEATINAAERYGVVHAGTGRNMNEAMKPAIVEVKGIKIALVASTTCHDERWIILPTSSSPGVNGVWTGYQEDWDRNLRAVRDAARTANFVIYYHHYQIDQEDLDGEGNDGHKKVDKSLHEWQSDFAKAMIDAGAAVYIAHGHRGFDGMEVYNGCPIFYQLGGFAYQGRNEEIGHYVPETWLGLLAMMTIQDGYVRSIEFIPLELDEGKESYGHGEDFLKKRGFTEVATGNLATKILHIFVDLSESYGTTDIKIRGEHAYIEIPGKPPINVSSR